MSDNFYGISQFLRQYNLPQLEQYENDNLSNPLTFKGMELTKKEISKPIWFHWNIL